MLRPGDRVPEFEAKSTEGKVLSSAGLLGRPFVLFFFPKAFTPGCTQETKAFRDEYPSLTALGVEVVGVSMDTHDRQCEFAEWAGVPFPMVGDCGGTLAKRFGVLWPVVSLPMRVTFVVDGGGLIRNVFHHEIRICAHVTDVRNALATLLGRGC